MLSLLLNVAHVRSESLVQEMSSVGRGRGVWVDVVE